MDVKEIVRKEYGEIATGRGTGCCGGGCADTAARLIGYDEAQLEAVPEGANLGLGCGNPTAIAALCPGEVVVDLGSGAGFDCFLASPRVGPTGRVIGVDMTEEMVAKAQSNAERGGYTNVEFRRGDIEALPLEDASVDVIISNCVLNLVPNKVQAFSEIARVLKPGGRIAVSDIVLARALPEEILKDGAVYAACISGAITRTEYLQTLRDVGLVEVEVTQAVDASDMLLQSPGPIRDLLRERYRPEELRSIASSIHVSARRPAAGGS